MKGVLVVAEQLRGSVRDVTRELITAAAELGGPVTVAVLGADPAALRAGVDVAGVDEIVEVRTATAEFENDVYQRAVEALIAERDPAAVLLGFTVNGMGYGPAIAAKLGLGFASDVFGLAREGGDGDRIVCRRAMYGGKVHAEVELPAGRPALIMLRPTAWPAATGPGGAKVTQATVGEPGSSRARHREFAEAPASDIDITTAEFLLSIGRGVESKDDVPYFEALARKMSATLAGSRPLIDSGWLPSARQVGQSGKTVKPKVYLALGISGAVQHLAGMKSSDLIIAVNSDPEASIFGVAHYGAVADLFDVARELEKLF
ncbi:MAG: electron transfer flavoprotein subunit alpha/FixB family protein [Nocardiopsaceae bacterium]|nr:electron transfer flavoprotein subunit alpha/FixB family protein [Nocardiopsaceae bacterium]